MPAEPIDLLFRAFSDRTRLRILHLLDGEGELCVGDLVAILKLPQSSTSRHLGYLRRAGFVEVRDSGHWKYYRLAPSRTELHGKLLDCLGACFRGVPELAKDRERARTLATRCC